MSFRTRFAPSPTGPLHLGHAFSAMLAHDMARGSGGDFLLRIEDIDRSRSRPEWEALIFDDLHWLGLSWEAPVLRQSERMDAYRAALEALWARGLLYPCTCNRRDILAAASAPQEGAPLTGPDGLVYPGTCRNKPLPAGGLPEGVALRLHMDRALAEPGVANGQAAVNDAGETACTFPIFEETGEGPNGETRAVHTSRETLCQHVGDIVLARRDMGTSYHLSVVVDDAHQRVSHVVRGQDLFEATQIHVVLQRLLGLPTPLYHHHRLIRDEAGKRLAKRDDARAIRTYRDEGLTPQDIRRMVGL